MAVGLWGLMVAAAGALAAIDLRYENRRPGAEPMPRGLVVCADALLLVGATWWLHALRLVEQAPRLSVGMQSLLLVAAGILGAYLAGRWFVEDRIRGRAQGVHSLTGIALMLLAVAGGVIGPNAGVKSGALAAAALAVVWAVLPLLSPGRLRWLRFGAALALLWAGSLGLYLMALPAQIVAENADSASSAGRGGTAGWAVAALLIAGLAVGFLKPKRGQRT